MLSHGAVMKYEYAYTTIDRLSKGEKIRKNNRGRDWKRWRDGLVFVCADLERDRISNLLLTEPTREPMDTCVADSGWKPNGAAVKWGARAGTMKKGSK